MRTRYTNQRDTGEAELALSQMQALVYNMHEHIFSTKMQMVIDLLQKFYHDECFVYIDRHFSRISIKDGIVFVTWFLSGAPDPDDFEHTASEYELDEIIDNLKNGEVYRNKRDRRDHHHIPLYAPLRIPDNPTLGVEEVQLR